VEAGVGLGVAVEVDVAAVRPEAGVEVGEDGPDAVQPLRRRTPLGSEAGGGAFEHTAQLDGVDRVREQEPPDHVAAAAALEHPLLGQPRQRLAHRRARNPQHLGQRHLVEPLPALELAADDPPAQLDQRPRRVGGGGFRHRPDPGDDRRPA